MKGQSSCTVCLMLRHVAVTLDTDELPPRERMKDIGDGLLSVGR